MKNDAQISRKILSKQSAIVFVVLFGFISLLADMTYEGSRSIIGPYLKVLGASATIVGIIAGLGELIGYGIRIIAGYITDKTKQYWSIVIIGYAINLIAVPLLALTNNWVAASILIIMERFGKAIRTPSRDAMLSLAREKVGSGWTYGLHESMDQIGAVLGPIIVAVALSLKHGDYRLGFGILLIPALLALILVIIGRVFYPHPENLEVKKMSIETQGFSHQYWIYIIAVSFIAMGFADFPLIAYHFQTNTIFPEVMIPILYAVAMGADAISALIFGLSYDRFGMKSIIPAVLISAAFAPFVFWGGVILSWIGVILWGIGMGWQESIMRSVIADITPQSKRGSSFGIFNTVYGIFWFLGSVIIGILYDFSITALVIFSVIIQIASIPLYLSVIRHR